MNFERKKVINCCEINISADREYLNGIGMIDTFLDSIVLVDEQTIEFKTNIKLDELDMWIVEDGEIHLAGPTIFVRNEHGDIIGGVPEHYVSIVMNNKYLMAYNKHHHSYNHDTQIMRINFFSQGD